MRKIIMDSKIKILIGVLVIGVILIGIWQAWEMGILNIIIRSCHQDSDCIGTCTFGCINRNSIYNEKIRCAWVSECKCVDNKCVGKYPPQRPTIATAKGIESYINYEVNVIGVLHCTESKVPCSIEFDDGTSLALSTDISDTGYGDKRVSLIARVYQCKPPDQCYGIILTDITSINLIEEEKVVADPFESLPQPTQPNCDSEYRFKFDVTINSKDEFILFLKTHQFEGDLLNYKSTEDRLIPSNTNQNQIDLDKLKTNVEIYKVENSKLSNKKIYILRIRNQDFNENWPWMITIIMSDKGYVSIKSCAGI